jgi:hypothetical protein
MNLPAMRTSFTVVILGLIVYFWHSTHTFFVAPLLFHLIIFVAEQQGTIDIRVPLYVTQRGAMESEVSEAGKQGVAVYVREPFGRPKSQYIHQTQYFEFGARRISCQGT